MTAIQTEYRVSWTMWPVAREQPQRTERTTMDYGSAMEQYRGLLGMEAHHPLRPCDEHIWEPKVESRRLDRGAWEPYSVEVRK